MRRDRRSFARVADLRPGMRVSVAGEITVAGLRRARRMAIYEVRLDDGSGRLKAVFFNQPYLKETLARGKKAVFFRLDTGFQYEFANLKSFRIETSAVIENSPLESPR
jgi:RecG-like helicase